MPTLKRRFPADFDLGTPTADDVVYAHDATTGANKKFRVDAIVELLDVLGLAVSEDVLALTRQAVTPAVGISTGNDPWTRTDAELAVDFAIIAASAGTCVRVPVKWSEMEDVEGVFDWAQFDIIVDAAHAAGLRVLGLIIQSPPWALTDGEPNANYSPTDPHDIVPFLEALVARYRDRGDIGGVRWWGMGNEVNTDDFFGAADPERYAALARVMYPTIKRADPGAVVISGSILGGGYYGAAYTGNMDDTEWLTRIYDAGAKGYHDAVAFHPYCIGTDPAATTPTGSTSGSSLAPDSTFATATTGWTGTNATLARVAGNVMEVTATGGAVADVRHAAVGGAITPGSMYLARAEVKAVGADVPVFARIQWYTAANAFISASAGPTTIYATEDHWTTFGIRIAAPALADRAIMVVATVNSASAGQKFQVRAGAGMWLSSDNGHGWNRVPDVRAVMDAYDDRVPMWFTEWGQHTGSAALAVSEATQATYVTSAINRYLAVDDVGPLFVHMHRNYGSDLTAMQQNFGVLVDHLDADQPARATYTAGAVQFAKPTQSRFDERAATSDFGIVTNMPGAIPGAAQVWGSSNQARYMRVHESGWVSKIAVDIGTSSGNLSVAVYRNSGVGRAATPTGGRLATSGAVASPGTGYREIALGALVWVDAGDWIGVSADNTTISFVGISGSANAQFLGICLSQSAAHPLPATPASLSGNTFRTPFVVGIP